MPADLYGLDGRDHWPDHHVHTGGARPSPRRGANVTSDSGNCGMLGLPGQASSAADRPSLARRVRLAEDQARIDEILAQTKQ